ncbi:MAG: TadE/TadG family type IV pilus assembly protein [Candidatus Sericytochromatia bacterium]|nr:TadE/TadG family type IV pilus assembly protein [Candidatus Sericytochromatia bacterium]
MRPLPARLQDEERGQALVEFSLVLPMLVVLLLGVAYCGGLVLAQQSLAVSARHVARSMALEATRQGLEDPRGRGGQPDEAVARRALNQAAPRGGAALAGVRWGALGASGRGMAGALVKRGTLPLGPALGNARCGIGVALYGATVKRDLSRDLSPLGRVAARLAPGGGLAGRLAPSLSATAVMPGELPIRGRVRGGVPGVLDLNPWIGKVVQRPYRPRSFE